MLKKVLVVDDEKNILKAMQRQMRRKFHIETALGPDEGLTAIKERGPYAVVVSDLRMPKMDGIQFLSRVKEMAPDTVRVMLTGNEYLMNADKAENEGNLFLCLTKPCSQEILEKVVQRGIEQYQIVMSEKGLLQNP